jgi:general secretion pathway protein J
VTRSPTRNQAGFTLVEILVAMTLVGLLSTLIFSGVRLGAQAWTKVEHRTADFTDIGAVQDVLRRTIASGYPAFASSDLTDRTVTFDGDRASLSLVAPLPAAIEAGVLARERFFVAQNGPTQALFMAWRLDLPSSDGAIPLPENEVPLLDHVRTAQFNYFGRPDDRAGPIWQDSWRGRRFLPEMVRLRIERDDPRLAPWPDLVSEPKATTTPACLYDPLAVSCRRIR